MIHIISPPPARKYSSYHTSIMARNTEKLEMSDDLHRQLIEECKKELLQSFSTLEARCKIDGKSMYHSNQEETAIEVANTILYDPAVVFQLVKAMTQTGKTGCMLAVIRSCFTLCGCDIKVNPDNIFIITGISSTGWTEQTKDRFPKALKDNIYHRGQLNKLSKRLDGLRDVVILMDEVHVASKEDMTISKLLDETGLKDMDYLREQNINFVEFSATPNKVMEDMSLWNEYAKQHVMQPGTGYKGVRHQLENGRVFQAKDLFIADNPDRIKMNEKKYNDRKKQIAPAYDAIGEIKEKIISYYDKPHYHIFRLPTGAKFDTVVSRFKEVFGDDDFYHAPCHSKSGENDVQRVIKDVPAKHTLIYIKEHLRCAVTLDPKENVGILYERVSGNDDVMIQGLSGRATGYDVPDKMLVFTNVESLERYTRVWESGFTNLGDFTYQGKRTKKSKTTVFHPDGFQNSGIVVAKPESLDDSWDLYQEESTDLVEINKFLKDNDCRQKKTFTKDERGFIKSSTTKAATVLLYSETKKVMESWSKTSSLDVKGKDGPAGRMYITYKDINDIDSVVYIARVVKKKQSVGAAEEPAP